MADIDSLQIKIKADANSASNALDKLATSLEGFRKSVAWDTGKLYSIGTGIKNISDAAVGFKGAKSKELSSLATALNNFDKVDTVSLRGVGSAMESLAHSMSGIQSIDVSGITSTAAAIAKLGGKNATQGTTNLLAMKDQLAEFVKGMNSVGTMTFDSTGLLNTANAISKLGSKFSTQATQNLPALSAQLQNFVRQMNNIGALNFDTTNLANLVTSISKLGSVASGRAVGNIPLLAKNLKGLFTTLSTAPNVSENIIRMTEALANLARTGSSSGRAAQSLGKSLDIFSKSASTARTKSFSLASAIGKLYASYWLLFRGFGKIKDAIDISSDLTEVENVVRQTFGNYESLIQDFSKTSIQQYGMSELMAKQVASRFQAMGTAMGFTQGKMADMSIELTKLTGDLASFYNEEQSDVARRLQSVFTGETEPLRRYGLDLTQATLKEYALSKGLDANISSMTQAEKTMLRYQYVIENTANAQGDFARTSDTWANQVRMLKQAFEAWSAVVGGALINAFKPFVKTLNQVMLKVIDFTKVVTEALGSIFGWKYEVSDTGIADDWSDALDSADGIADATGETADNISKMNKGIRAFDKLNVISTSDKNKTSGAGAGGTGSSLSGGLTKVDTIFENYESNIKDLFTLGRTISDKLSEAMESIDWQSIYEKARNFGTGLAQFLNGLITPRLFGDVGKTIASALNTAIYAALSFGQEFDFVNLGESLAQGVNDFFDTFDFKALGKTINTWVQGLKDTIITFLDKVEWKDVFKGIKDTLSELDISTIAILVGAFTLKHAGKALTSDILKNIVLGKLFTAEGGAFLLKLGGITLEVAISAVVAKAGFEVGKWIGKQLFPDDKAYYDDFTWFGDGGFFDTIFNTDKSTLFDAFKQMNSESKKINTDSAKSLFSNGEKGKRRGNGFEETESSLTKLVRKFKNAVEDLQDNFFYRLLNGTLFLPTHSAVEDMEDKIQELIDKVNNSKIDVSDTFGLSSALIKLAPLVADWFAENVQPWLSKEKWSELGENVKTSLSDKWTSFKTWWNDTGFPDWWNRIKTQFSLENWNKVLDNVPKAFKTAFKTAANVAIAPLNLVISGIETMINNAIDLINGLLSAARLIPKIGNEVPNNISHILVGRIPAFETGGYVPSRYTMFMAGENGIPEIAGTVGGKTAVAGGAEITGIKDAIYKASQEEMALLRQQNQLLQGILQKEFGITSDQVGKAAQQYASEQYNQKHKNVFVF